MKLLNTASNITNNMLNIIDNLNSNCIPKNPFLNYFRCRKYVSHIHNVAFIESAERLVHTRSILKVHYCRFENFRICACLYKSNTLKIPHS